MAMGLMVWFIANGYDLLGYVTGLIDVDAKVNHLNHFEKIKEFNSLKKANVSYCHYVNQINAGLNL